MKAFIISSFGAPSVLKMQEVPRPVPGENELLVKVMATTVTSADCRLRARNMPRGFRFLSGLIFGFKKPRKPILGSEMAGIVTEIGSKVTRFHKGDAVFAMDGMNLGCYAEYKLIREDAAIVQKPESLTFEEAASLPFGALTAIDFFRRGKLKSGDHVLINGASGSVGTAALQIAVNSGAVVTAVCSGANRGLVQSLGATHVIDYKTEDFTLNGQTYDMIMDTAGTAPYSRSGSSLKPDGRLLLVLASLPDTLRSYTSVIFSKRKVIAGPATEKQEDLEFLARLVERGLYKPVIDRIYSFEDLPEAHTYTDSGRKKGNVVISLSREAKPDR
jgi:NADPH:quinone reductase-like Zn-dependent oxidoreductase